MTAITPFRGGRILGASWNPENGSHAAERLREQLAEWRVVSGNGWLIATDGNAHQAEASGHIIASAVTHLFDRGTATLCTAETLAPRIARNPMETFDSLGTPYRLIWVDKTREEIGAVVDTAGISPMFWLQNDKIAVCSSSARLLARLFKAAPSMKGVANFALMGVCPLEGTPYEGINQLLGRTCATLHRGKLTLIPRQPPEFGDDDIGEAFQAAVTAMSQACPTAALELSGGIDSRLILAALPPANRANHAAITINATRAESDDLRIARQIAAIMGVPHSTITVPFAILEDGGALDQALRVIVDGYDTMGNPVDKLPLVLSSQSGQVARFGGPNGELVHGNYYALQPLASHPTTKLITDLVDWRVISNDRTSPKLFSESFTNDALGSARADLITEIGRYEGSWGNVLDQVCLDYRIQPWAGNGAGNLFIDRAIFWPYLDARFLEAALKLDPAYKLDSRGQHQILGRLAPQLASVPLNTGLVPKVMANDDFRATLMVFKSKVLKAKRKLAQRIRPRSFTDVLGSQQVIDAWCNTGGYKRLDLHAMASLGIFDAAALEALGAGQIKPDRGTLGFLLMCEAWLQP